MAHKVFENKLAEAAETPSFELQERPFECLAQPAPAVIGDLARLSTQGSVGTGVMANFIRACLKPEFEGAWDELAYSKDVIISRETIGDVFEFLVDQYFRRPFPQPSDSPDGSSSTPDS